MNLFIKQSSELIMGCKANDRSAQEALYKLFYKEMLRLCYRYHQLDALAQEALNTGFLKVFQNIASFDETKGEPGVWIRTIMVRTCIDLARKEAKFKTIESTDEISDDIFIAPAILEKLYTDDILKAIRTLPKATQLVFNLYVMEGYSHQEIGVQLQIGESTSRWHLSEARKQLKTMLQFPHKSDVEPTENKNKLQ